MNRFMQQLQKPSFLPFFMLCDPSLDKSVEVIKLAIDNGVHGLELGIPFSDPVADGPTIQQSHLRALENGASLAKSFEALAEIRRYAPELPISVMVYFNLIYQAGVENFHQRLQALDLDAIIAVDLPLEESSVHQTSLTHHGLGSIQLIAPNTADARAQKLLDASTAFSYVISDFGTTGVRSKISEASFNRVKHLRHLNTTTPLVVGFGVSTAEQVKQYLKAGANGVIIGSAISKLIANHNLDGLKALCQNCSNICEL